MSDIGHSGPRAAATAQVLPREDAEPGQRDADDDDEVEEAGRERGVGVDAQVAEEADEERFADGDPVQRDRQQHDQEEERPHHVVDARRDVYADGLAAHPDREHAHYLYAERQREDAEHQGNVLAVRVQALVDRADRAFDAEEPQQRHRPRQQRPQPAGEQNDREQDRSDHEGALDPQVGPDVVVADGEGETDRGEYERRGAAKRPFEDDRGRDRPALAGVAPRGLEDPHRVATDRPRQQLAAGVGDEVGAHEPGKPVANALRREQPLPPPGHRPDRADRDRGGGEEVPDVRVDEDVQRPRDVDLPDQVRQAQARDDQRRDEPEQPASHEEGGLGGRFDRARGCSMGATEAYEIARVDRLAEGRPQDEIVHVGLGAAPQLGVVARDELGDPRAVRREPDLRLRRSLSDPERRGGGRGQPAEPGRDRHQLVEATVDREAVYEHLRAFDQLLDERATTP